MAIDTLASEYGWGKEAILESVYPDELFYLTKEIKKRRVGHYRMLLAIAQNPYSKNPRELAKQLEPEEIRSRSDKLNVESVEMLRGQLDKRSGFKVK
jgi:hypothetical protein